MVSLAKVHYPNQWIKVTGWLSVDIVDDALLPQADYAGCVSGAKVDKSELFAYRTGGNGVPTVEASPLVMECEVVDNCKTKTFDSFICRILASSPSPKPHPNPVLKFLKYPV